MNDPINLPLSQPINAHGEVLNSLTLRPVTARDLRLCGYPLIPASETEVRFDTQAAAKLIVACANIPTSSVDTMSAADFKAAMMAVISFLEDTTPAPSST